MGLVRWMSTPGPGSEFERDSLFSSRFAYFRWIIFQRHFVHCIQRQFNNWLYRQTCEWAKANCASRSLASQACRHLSDYEKALDKNCHWTVEFIVRFYHPFISLRHRCRIFFGDIIILCVKRRTQANLITHNSQIPLINLLSSDILKNTQR